MAPHLVSASSARLQPAVAGAAATSTTAAAVLHELQRRYHKWHLRNLNYSRLLAFLSFIVLLLGVLFLQRSSGTSYQVHSTLASGLLPEGAINSVDDVYTWLSALLTTVWRDPVCGDGVCESPFEHAQYGRFGCRADCGRLEDIQNLTALQIDLSFDFSHPAGSIPATELQRQASWNLCPAGDSSGCYWKDDQTFEQLMGGVSVIVPDVPDGTPAADLLLGMDSQWALVLKRDIFGKVAGDVRSVLLLERQAEAAKVAIALGAAAVQHASERLALEEVVELGSVDEQALVNATLEQQYAAQLAEAAAQLQGGTLDAASYAAEAEALEQQLKDDLHDLLRATASCPSLPFYQPDPAVVAVDSEVCEKFGNLTQLVLAQQLDDLCTLILARMAPASTAAEAALDAGLAQLQSQMPELYAVVHASRGQNASQPASAMTRTLADYYADPWTAPAPARAALASRMITTARMTAAGLVDRAEARIQELKDAELVVRGLPEVQVALSLTSPGGQLPYDLVCWDGGSGTYATCNLGIRTPQYVGTCTPLVPCSNSSTSDASGEVQVTYACAAADPLLSSSDACGDLCDTQNICTALCECEPACGAGQVCQCDACTKVGSARSDPDFQAMRAAAGLASTASIQGPEGEDIVNPDYSDEEPEAAQQWSSNAGTAASRSAGSSGNGRRRLHQSSDAMLQTVLDAVGTLQGTQAALQQQVQALQTVATDAAAAAQDSSVQALIAAGQKEIVSRQMSIQDMLAEVLGKQSAAATAAAAQMQALSNLQSLQQQQLAAQAQLEQSARDQTNGIAQALQQALLSSSQALELYRRVRLQALVASKAAVLASVPCTSSTTTEYGFAIDQNPDVVINTSRERYIGTSNRVIAGLLLFNQRGLPAACANARFTSIGGTCKRGLDRGPYGVDPVFKLGTSLYNPDLDSLQGITARYNCSLLPQQTYNVTVEGSFGAEDQLTNPPPFCAELYSPRSLPYGFHSSSLTQFGDGFPVLFDINLDAGSALNWLAFIQEGLYLDSRTQRLLAQVVTYNAELRFFSSAVVAFDFVTGGSVQVSHHIQTLRVELYTTGLDTFRLVLEVALTLCITIMAFTELQGMCRVARLTGNPLSYFTSGWRAMEFASTCLLVACVTMWWVLVWRHALPFSIALHFNVYADLGADAALLTLADGGAGLQDMHAAFSKLQSLSDKLAWYAALTGINLLMLIARLLQLLDFQPRLGVVTRSLAHAGPDLLHFGLVFSLVFVGYAMLAHLIFGNSIAGFSSFGSSVNTCFALLLGDTAVNADLQALSGLQAVAGAAFFWTYEVLVFLVLLNFLLAIIVDAFGQVKERTTDTTGLHTEVAQMLRHAYHSATSRFSRDRISDVELSKLLHWWRDSERSAVDINGMVDEREALLQDKLRPKMLRVHGKVVQEEELRAILQAHLLEEEQESDIEESRSRPGGASRLMGSLGLKRQPNLSQKPIRPVMPDLGQVAHYVMLRFGEDELLARQDGRQSADGSRRHSGQQRCKLEQQVLHQGSDFCISAYHGADGPSGGSVVVGSVAGDALLPRAAEIVTSGISEASNGQHLAHVMLSETEQRGAADAAVSLMQWQGILSEAQQRLLNSQRQLSAQQAAVLEAVHAAASSHQAAEGSKIRNTIETGWLAPLGAHQASPLGSPSSSFRQRAVLCTDSGRLPGQLPPGRLDGGSHMGGARLRLSDSSEEER